MLILTYFKKIIGKWWALLGLLPAIYDSNSAYISYYLPKEYENFKIGPHFTNIIVGLSLFFASYLVWKEEYNLRLSIESVMAEREKKVPKYEPSAIVLDEVKFDHVLEGFETEREWLNVKLSELAILTKPSDKAKNSGLEELLRGYESAFIEPKKEYYADLQKYDVELLAFKKELLEQTEKYKIFKVCLQLKNVGSVFDENINVIIKPAKFSFYEPYQLTKSVLPPIPDRPRDPMKMPNFNLLEGNYRESDFLDYFESTHQIRYGYELIDPDYMQVHEISPNLIEVELDKLASHQTADLVMRNLIIHVERWCEKIEFDFEIKSKNTQQPLIYKLNVKLSSVGIVHD